jgi:hypothetical protein
MCAHFESRSIVLSHDRPNVSIAVPTHAPRDWQAVKDLLTPQAWRLLKPPVLKACHHFSFGEVALPADSECLLARALVKLAQLVAPSAPKIMRLAEKSRTQSEGAEFLQPRLKPGSLSRSSGSGRLAVVRGYI